ncbi:DUF4097 family beta strand repeat-containing protein [Kitasatospora sp. NPDC096147]|uniref:DUF4097 family beta strand repeat-containing protein n=1 Tax=Kitasatospora sp. NPDC096147 TaxID=3364093 RepID=UPI003818DCE3
MQTYATTAPVTAVLDIAAGRVQLIAADRADTTVEVRPATPGRSRDVRAAELTVVAFEDGVLRVSTPEAARRALGPSGSVEVTVQLPAGSRVEATVAAADLRAVGRLGEVVLTGAAGSVKIDEAAAARIGLQAGDVRLARLTGDAEISTVKGDLDVAEAHRGTLALRTGAGHITVGAARGVSAALDAGTAHGRVSNALRNDGTPVLAVSATTSYGDITARSL